MDVRGHVLIDSRRLAACVGIPVMLASILTVAGAAQAADSEPAPSCVAGAITSTDPKSKQINIVIDDSGSMFYDGKKALDRWSFAKYSLEVFAALMGPNDAVDVYLMSDFKDGETDASPRVQLRGSDVDQSRVEQIRAMQLDGGGTPYAPVSKAHMDLQQSTADEKWLVVLTDGKFQAATGQDISAARVQSELESYVTDNPGTRVAVLAVGSDAASIPGNQELGITSVKAATSRDLLTRMADLSNLIFERTLAADAGFTWSTDIPTKEVVVFAQGRDVQVGSAETPQGAKAPAAPVTVQWSENGPADYDGRRVPAVPDKTLQGQLAKYESLPAGQISFDISNPEAVVQVFYKPDVQFGAILRDDQNNELRADDEMRSGDYSLDYGFFDENCEPINSKLLGDIEYSATVTQNGKIVAENVQPGDSIPLEAGDVTFDVKATFLNNLTSNVQITRRALAPVSKPVATADRTSFPVSELENFPSPDKAMLVQLVVVETESKVQRPMTAEEWASFQTEDVVFESTSNLEFELAKGEQVGQVYVSPRAPGGDVFSADTGQIGLRMLLPALTADNEPSTVDLSVEVIDDLSQMDRWLNWWRTIGWKLLLLLLLVILLLGYLFKRRFSKKMKRRPSVTGIPNQVGTSVEEGTGKFRVNGVRKFLPFVADTATLVYVPPGVSGFRPLKLKAGPRKSMVVTNWKQVAERKNVAINGMQLDEETRRAPSFGPSATITASAPRMTYDMTPSS